MKVVQQKSLRVLGIFSTWYIIFSLVYTLNYCKHKYKPTISMKFRLCWSTKVFWNSPPPSRIVTQCSLVVTVKVASLQLLALMFLCPVANTKKHFLQQVLHKLGACQRLLKMIFAQFVAMWLIGGVPVHNIQQL